MNVRDRKKAKLATAMAMSLAMAIFALSYNYKSEPATAALVAEEANESVTRADNQATEEKRDLLKVAKDDAALKTRLEKGESRRAANAKIDPDDSTLKTPTPTPKLGAAILVVSLPTVTMLLGSLVAVCSRIPDNIQAGMQNFSAGILIAAVANELFPLIKQGACKTQPCKLPPEVESYSGLILGFFIGLTFMFGIEFMVENIAGDDDDSDTEEEAVDSKDEITEPLAPVKTDTDQAMSPKSKSMAKKQVQKDVGEITRLTLALESAVTEIDDAMAEGEVDEVVHKLMFHVDQAKRHLRSKDEVLTEHNKSRMAFHAKELLEIQKEMHEAEGTRELRGVLSTFDHKLHHLHGHAENKAFRRWQPQPPPPKDSQVFLSEEVPWATVFAVTVDAAVDGLLIGLAYSANTTAGLSVAIATCIEMGFLGLSFSATIQNVTRSVAKHISIVVVPPLALIIFGIIGHETGGALEAHQGVFIGFITFSIVALLFLVTQELLAEAREVDGGQNIYINIMFFIGLLAGILMDKGMGP